MIDFDIIFRVVIVTIATVVMVAIPWREQYKELSREVDKYTRLRWIMLIFLSGIILFGLPSLFYSFGLLIGVDLDWMKSLARVSGALWYVTVVAGFVVIYMQKIPRE